MEQFMEQNMEIHQGLKHSAIVRLSNIRFLLPTAFQEEKSIEERMFIFLYGID